jgi:hypothetical protein
MTLRTKAQHDEAIARLAERYGVSKHEAVLRAVELADNEAVLEDDAMAAYERVSGKYRDALDRLGSG